MEAFCDSRRGSVAYVWVSSESCDCAQYVAATLLIDWVVDDAVDVGIVTPNASSSLVELDELEPLD